jgi:hypothetical protein
MIAAATAATTASLGITPMAAAASTDALVVCGRSIILMAAAATM